MTNCLAVKCSLPCLNGHHHERSINFSASLVHFNTIPTGWVSQHYSLGLILSLRRSSEAVASHRQCIPKCAVKTLAVIITALVYPKMYIFLATLWKVSLADFLSSFYFLHFYRQNFAPIGLQKKPWLWLVVPKNIPVSNIVIFQRPQTL